MRKKVESGIEHLLGKKDLVRFEVPAAASADGCGIAVPWLYVRMNVTAISGTGASVSGILAAAT